MLAMAKDALQAKQAAVEVCGSSWRAPCVAAAAAAGSTCTFCMQRHADRPCPHMPTCPGAHSHALLTLVFLIMLCYMRLRRCYGRRWRRSGWRSWRARGWPSG